MLSAEYDSLFGNPDSPAASILSHEPLSETEQRELGDRAAAGCRDSRERLILTNARMAFHMAKKYCCASLSFRELFSEALQGLVDAVDAHEVGGVPLHVRVRCKIIDRFRVYRANMFRPVRLPRSWLRLSIEVQKIEDEYVGRRSPSNEAIARQLGCRVRKVGFLRREAFRDVSFQQPLGTDSEQTLGDMLGVKDASMEEIEQLNQVSDALDCLPAKERAVIVRYFGMEGHKEQTLEEIGAKLRLSMERIRQLKVNALKKLRYELRGRELGIRKSKTA